MSDSLQATPVTQQIRLASVEITRRCNRSCAYCQQIKADEDMSVARFTDILDGLIALGANAIALGGGEPTLHPECAALLKLVHSRHLRVGLTTNGRDPEMVTAWSDTGMLDGFGVSAGKERWRELAAHPHATVNLLLLTNGLAELGNLTCEAIRCGAHQLLLMGYKGDRAEFRPTTVELASAFRLLTRLGRKHDIVVAADDYTRRRLALTQTCGDMFVRVDLEGKHYRCCFPSCEFYADAVRNPPSLLAL